jgi:hypothetical protein
VSQFQFPLWALNGPLAIRHSNNGVAPKTVIGAT